MDDRRFLSILNESMDECGLDPYRPVSPDDPAAVAAWAGFLSRCMSRGISITDTRWSRLELRRRQGGATIILPPGTGRRPDPESSSQDFRVGLSLLISMLGDDAGDTPLS